MLKIDYPSWTTVKFDMSILLTPFNLFLLLLDFSGLYYILEMCY